MRAHGKSSGQGVRGRTDFTQRPDTIELRRCKACGCTNACELDEKRADVCASCGTPFPVTTCTVKDFTPKRMRSRNQVKAEVAYQAEVAGNALSDRKKNQGKNA